MKAPDRIWLQLDAEWRRCQICKGSGGQQMAFDHDFPDAVEYLRKGAFPVEEMRAFYECWKDSPGDALGIKFVERILSLLEGANGGMGDE